MYGKNSYLDGGPSLSSMYAEAYRNDPALSQGMARARTATPRRTPMGPGELRNALNQPLSSMYAEAYRNDPSLAQGMVRRRSVPQRSSARPSSYTAAGVDGTW